MKNAKPWQKGSLSLGFFLAVSFAGCKSLPVTEVCIIGDSSCICVDPRKPEPEREYELTFEQCRNYVARSPQSEKIIRDWAARNCTAPEE